MDEKCRKLGVPFIWATQYGSLLSAFVDDAGKKSNNPEGFCRDADSVVVHIGHVDKVMNVASI